MLHNTSDGFKPDELGGCMMHRGERISEGAGRVSEECVRLCLKQSDDKK